ncbi:hypothetical protein DFH08DRAFT_796994 [Mycena albidolilacea]|uniref:Uncharacterized protein n=1 Tax=Mycena albidolilacea TaxID=1033008 RepID=A0AAD7F7I2_9AGAR|nr:hypothetical protein DFH08DRAFT_796994 [Mycena albidolilacea]
MSEAVVNVANSKKAMQYFQEGISKLSEPLFGIKRKATACQEVVKPDREKQDVFSIAEFKLHTYNRDQGKWPGIDGDDWNDEAEGNRSGEHSNNIFTIQFRSPTRARHAALSAIALPVPYDALNDPQYQGKRDRKPGRGWVGWRKEQRAKSKEQKEKSKEQRAKSKEQKEKSKEQRAKSKEQKEKSKDQRAKSKEQRAKSKEQRAKSKEQRAKSKEQRAKSKEQRAKRGGERGKE